MMRISDKLSFRAIDKRGVVVQTLECIESLLELSRELCKTLSVTPQSAESSYHDELDKSILDAIIDCRCLAGDTYGITALELGHREFSLLDLSANAVIMINQIKYLCPNFNIQDLIDLREKKLSQILDQIPLTGEEIDLLEEPRRKECVFCGTVYHHNATHDCDDYDREE